MSTTLRARPAEAGTGNGGVPARRAVVRWAWRLFRREWRQQLLILALLTVAVGGTILGAAVATNIPPALNAATFGTATNLISLPGSDPHLAADIAAIENRFHPVDVIEDETSGIPGSVGTMTVRAQNPNGPYGHPMLSLAAGRYPAGPGEVALSSQLASLLNLRIGAVWHVGGQARRVVGLVENPQNLLDDFALVAPGQVSAPTQVNILLDAGGTASAPSVTLPDGATVPIQSPTPPQTISPAVIVLVLAVLGLLFIGLVAVAGFTVMAQRRLRALGMLSAVGATDRNVRLVMIANGAVVGLLGTLLGAALGFAAWFAYAPHLQVQAGHLIDPLNLPWWAIISAMVLAVLTSIVAARRPARSIARIPAVAALSGRPAAPKAAHRRVLPGLVLLAAGPLFLAFSGGWAGHSQGDTLLVLMGVVATAAGGLLLAPLCIPALAAGARYTPIAVRLALRDLARYLARSGAALRAITLGVFIATLVCILATARFANILDYTGPNLTANQLILYTQNGPYGGGGFSNAGPVSNPTPAAMHALLTRMTTALGTHNVLTLESAVLPGNVGGGQAATLYQVGPQNNNYSSPLYVATPGLLRHYGIKPSQIGADTDVLSMRPGLAAEPRMLLIYGYNGPGGFNGAVDSFSCVPKVCAADPQIQTFTGLPSGTSAPNTVITTHAVRRFGLQEVTSGWLIQTPRPLTTQQISAAQQMAAGLGLSIETKSGELGLSAILNGATAVAVLLALGVLAMTVGLIRSETASDLRTLTATGASGIIRRTLTGATAGALGLLGALTGTAMAYIAAIAWYRSSLSTTVSNVPVHVLVVVVVVMPLAAAIAGWLLGGREPAAIGRRPIE